VAEGGWPRSATIRGCSVDGQTAYARRPAARATRPAPIAPGRQVIARPRSTSRRIAGDHRNPEGMPPSAGDTITTRGGQDSSRIHASNVKVLLVSARLPAPGGKGDQLRAFQFIEAIADHHTVEVVTTGAGTRVAGAEVGLLARATVRLARAPIAVRAFGAVGALLRGQPAQVGWMMPGPAWRTVRRRAADADVVLAMTVRSLRGPLAPPLILDHVDALSVNMRRRANGPESALIRWAVRLEGALLERWERRLTRHARAQLAISTIDAQLLPSPPEVRVVPNCVDVSALPSRDDKERDIDLILTGDMAYPPNAAAARWLSEAIAPALWSRRPDASIWVVGRNAERLALDPRLSVRSNVEDVAVYLGRAKVALAPLRIGTGSPNKVLEAIAAGAAVAATTAAVEPFAFPPDTVVTADDALGLAAAAEGLLADASMRSAMAERARAILLAYRPEAQRERLEAILAEVARRQQL
jgi:polysaccharide biosynthesis protein PslH